MEATGCPQSHSTSNDNVNKIIEEFSETLKTFKSENCVNLYKQGNTVHQNKCKYKPTDVISGVASAVKMMQKADKVVNCKDNSVLKEFKNSSFWSLDIIRNDCKYNEGNTYTSNVHQCGPETQNMIEVAQILTQMISHHGVTQEFDTSFTPETKIVCDQNEILFDTKKIAEENNIVKNEKKSKNICNLDNHKFLDKIQSLPEQISREKLILSVENTKLTHNQFEGSTSYEIVTCQNQIKLEKAMKTNGEHNSCQTLSYSNKNNLSEDIELLPTQILPKKENYCTNLQSLPYSYDSKFTDEEFFPTQLLPKKENDSTSFQSLPYSYDNKFVNDEFISTQLLPKKDSEYSDCQISHSDKNKHLENTDCSQTQILPKKENSVDSKQTTFTCDKITESIDSDIIINSDKSSQIIADIIPKSPVLSIKKVIVKSSTAKFEKEKFIVNSPVYSDDLSRNSSSNISNGDNLPKQDSNAFSLNHNNGPGVKSDSPFLYDSSNPVGIVSDFNFFEKFEEIVSPVVHKYTNCDKATLKAKIVSKMESKDPSVRLTFDNYSDKVLIQCNNESLFPKGNYHNLSEIKEESDFDYELIKSDEESDYVKGETSESPTKNSETTGEVVFLENQSNNTNSIKVACENFLQDKSTYKLVQKSELSEDNLASQNGFLGSGQFCFLPEHISLDLSHNVNKMSKIDSGDKEIKPDHSQPEKEFKRCEISLKEDIQFQNSGIKVIDVKSIAGDKFSNDKMEDNNANKEVDIFDDMFEADNFPETEVVNITNIEKCTSVPFCSTNDEKVIANLTTVKISEKNQKGSFGKNELVQPDFGLSDNITKSTDNVNVEQTKKELNYSSNVLYNKQCINDRIKDTFSLKEHSETQSEHPSQYSSNNECTSTANKYHIDFITESKKIGISNKAIKKVTKPASDWEKVNSNIFFDSYNKTLNENPKLHTVEYSDNVDEEAQVIDNQFKELADYLQVFNAKETQEFTNTAMNAKLSNIPAYVGFSTVSKKRIQVTEISLQKTKRIFENINFAENHECKFLSTNRKATENTDPAKSIVTSPAQIPSFIEFHTASNKKINVSGNALKKIKNIFSSCEFEQNDLLQPISGMKNGERDDVNNVEHLQLYEENPDIFGVEAVCNKEVEKSRKALTKTKKTFKSWENGQENRKTSLDVNILKGHEKLTKNVDKGSEMPTFNGFRTTNNKKIEILEEAKQKAGRVLEGLEYDNKYSDGEQKEGHMGNIDFDMIGKAAFVGFQTGNGKKIDISEDALKRAKKALSTCEFRQDCTKTAEEEYVGNLERLEVNDKNSYMFGFQTANNRKIDIPKEVDIPKQALKNANKIFEDWEEEKKILNSSQDVLQDVNAHSEIPMFIEIRTASNKKTEISEWKTRKVLEGLEYEIKDLDEEPKKECINTDFKMMSKGPQFVGLQTASHKKVNITEKTLKESRKIFEDFDCNQDRSDVMKDGISKVVPAFIGFSTASHKRVKKSEDALARTKDMFNECTDGDKERITAKPFQKKHKLDSNTESNSNNSTINKVSLRNVDTGMLIINANLEIDTQLSKNFNDTNCTGDFYKNVSPYQRSASPILKCQNSKRRKLSETQHSGTEKYLNVELKNLIDTQVTNDFHETVHTEEFHNDPTPTMRSSSPVLQCSSAKRKQIFRTPFSKKVKIDTAIIRPEMNKQLPEFAYKYNTDYKKVKKYSLYHLQVTNDTEYQPNLDIDLEGIMYFEFDAIKNGVTRRRMSMFKLKKIFMQSPEIDRKIIPEGWFENHMKQIAWKLISYEMKFFDMKNVFSVGNVLDQLKYRYDRELYNCERPSLRKILEKDEISSRTIVLCVMKIISNGATESSSNSDVELVLTDGWYSIKTIIDNLLKRMVSVGRIKIGTKIMTQGAELVNCDQGIAPWEDTTNVRLKIYGNSTRRVRWNTRLGFHGNSAILVPLSSVRTDGGKVSKLKVFVARVYPLLYVEKFEDGSTVTRSERLEHLYEAKCEAERQMMLEKIYDEVEKEFDDKSSSDSEEGCVYGSGYESKMETGSQIAKCMKKCKDPLEFQSNLSESQSNLLKQYTSRRQERKLKELHDRIQEKIKCSELKIHRNITALLKVRIVDIRMKGDYVEMTKGLLSVWNVNENVTEMMKEGKWIEALNVLPTGMRGEEIKISANRHSVFSKSSLKDEHKLKPYMEKLSRICTPIGQIAKYPFVKHEFNEIDTVGLVFSIEPTVMEFKKLKNQYLQNVYLTDEKRKFICINFWGGLHKFGLENLIDTGQIVTCSNLQMRYGKINEIIPQLRATEFSCFTRIPKNSKSRTLYEELKNKMIPLNISTFCGECLRFKNINCRRDNNENISPCRSNNNACVLSKSNLNSVLSTAKTRNLTVNLNKLDLSDIDFESVFKNVNMDGLSPSERLRKKRLNEKLQKLRMYDEPPKLSPIHIINRSAKANNSYTSPLLENVAVFTDVVNERGKNINCSINANNIVTPKNVNSRTRVDRSTVNPTKLVFCVDVTNEKNPNVDMFSEEFDPSPPLSLDSQNFETLL